MGHLDRNAGQGLDLRVVVDEIVLRVVVEPGEDLLYGGVAEVYRNSFRSLLLGCRGPGACQAERQPQPHSPERPGEEARVG